MSILPDFALPNFKDGMIREDVIDEMLAQKETVQLSLNLSFDALGAVKLRKGVTLLGAQVEAGKSILGMENYRNNAGTIFQALAKVDEDVYMYDGATWTSIRSSITAGSKASFTNFVDYTFMVNGNANDSIASYGGTGSFGTTNTASLPQGDFIENYRSRIWVADNSVDKVYYTDVVNTDNSISGGGDFIQISPADGEKITALKRHPRALLVFKQNHIYRIFSTTSVDPDPSILRGTYSAESVIESKDGISYHHPSGFYNFVFEGDQTEISRAIDDIVKAIPRSSYESIVGWSDSNHKYWSIGDITLKGVNFTNIVCRFTISTQVWTVYSYEKQITSAGQYDSGTDLVQLVGDEDGNVLEFDKGTTDNGAPIFYDLRTHWYYITEVKSTLKSIPEVMAMHENAQGAQLQYQIDSDISDKWHDIGKIKEDVTQKFTIDAKNFRRIRFRMYGHSHGSPFTFRGWEVLNSFTEGIPQV